MSRPMLLRVQRIDGQRFMSLVLLRDAENVQPQGQGPRLLLTLRLEVQVCAWYTQPFCHHAHTLRMHQIGEESKDHIVPGGAPEHQEHMHCRRAGVMVPIFRICNA